MPYFGSSLVVKGASPGFGVMVVGIAVVVVAGMVAMGAVVAVMARVVLWCGVYKERWKNSGELGMVVVETFNPSSQETEADKSL